MAGAVQVKRTTPRRNSKQDAVGSYKQNSSSNNNTSTANIRSSRGRRGSSKVHPLGDSVGAIAVPGSAANRRNNRNSRRSASSARVMSDNNAVDGNSNSNTRRSSSQKLSLSIDTSDSTTNNNSNELRSPGVPRTPLGAQAAAAPNTGGYIPDFITQTDANGNATTPRSAQAIEGARKVHPTGPRPNLHVDRRGQLTEDDNNDDDNDDSSVDDACESIVDSFRLMCCCLLSGDPTHAIGKSLPPSKTYTEDSDSPKSQIKLLGPHHPDDTGKKCLVLDLDETLVHSSFRPVPNADFVIPVQIEDVVHFVYVIKRPGVDEFLVEMAKHFEIVIYTASLNKYADPLLDLLDPHKTIRTRLFRESCVFYEGNYVKDLSLLDRDLANTIIIDNSPSSYMFHPENAIDCTSFIDDPRDRELDQIGGFLTSIKDAKDVRGICHQWKDWPAVDPAARQ